MMPMPVVLRKYHAVLLVGAALAISVPDVDPEDWRQAFLWLATGPCQWLPGTEVNDHFYVSHWCSMAGVAWPALNLAAAVHRIPFG
jgi:hypothetical protein